MKTTTIESIDLPTGVRLQYAEQGERGGVPVVLLHGVTDSWRSYEHIFPLLPDRVHAIALTQRGHGDSEHPAGGYRIEDLAADAAALIDALELGPAMVVGHSMGAWVAEGVAIGHPECVAGLVLAGAFGPGGANAAIAELMAETAGLTDAVDPVFVREFQVSTVTRPLPEGMLDMVCEESLKLPARVWHAVCGGFRDVDYTAELAGIAAPTLVIWGDRDAYVTRPEGDYLTSRIPDSRLVIYEGTGHAVHWEEPERFAAELTAFIRDVA